MKILVTGGAGFIASHIADAYIKAGHTVAIVDDLSTGRREYINTNAKFYRADITDSKKIEEIIAKEKPLVINHHAAQMSVRRSVAEPQFDAKVNLLGLLNLLEAGIKYKLKKVIFASSGGVVYGESKVIPTPEDYVPLLPLSPYGVTKLASEYYLHYYQRTYGLSYLNLRYANIYGPRQNPHGEAGVVAIFSKKLLSGIEPVINGTGKQTRDYTFVSDVVDANLKALESDVIGSFNIGTGLETDVVTLYGFIRRAAGSKIQAKFGPLRPGEQLRSALKFTKAKKILNWQPKVSLEKGISKTVDYFRQFV